MITSGEWKWRTNEQCPGALKGCIVEAGGTRIADILARPLGSQADCESNAALVASAPDLLAALKEADIEICDKCGNTNVCPVDCASCAGHVARIALVAKAEGKA